MSPNSFSPITLFVYNRPEHTRLTLNALKLNNGIHKTKLFVFADAAKPNASDKELELINLTRKVVEDASSELDIDIIAATQNKGLAASILDGVTKVIDLHGSAIILEDDLECAPHFLEYMNESLKFYKDNEDVMLIGGYTPPEKISIDKDVYLLRFASSWGWATWKNSWDKFISSPSEIRKQIDQRNLKRKFDFNNSNNFYQMLKEQESGLIDSWAIRWNGTVFLNDGLGLYPKESLVRNIGFDGTGVHCGSEDDYNIANLPNKKIDVKLTNITDNIVARQAYEMFYKRANDISLTEKVKYIFNREVKRLKKKF